MQTVPDPVVRPSLLAHAAGLGSCQARPCRRVFPAVAFSRPRRMRHFSRIETSGVAPGLRVARFQYHILRLYAHKPSFVEFCHPLSPCLQKHRYPIPGSPGPGSAAYVTLSETLTRSCVSTGAVPTFPDVVGTSVSL